MRFGLREFIFIVLLLAMPVAAYFLIFKTENEKIQEAKAEILVKQEDLRRLESVTGKIDDLGKEIDDLIEAIALFEEKLPDQRQVEVVLKQVWELAAKHGLTPKKISSEKPIPTAQYSELPLKMTIIGDFDGFYSFLLDLENLRRITRMPEMVLEKAKKGHEGQMEATVILSVFFETGR